MNKEVNFELAKLLKEKGFPQLNTGLYYTKDKEHCLVGWGFNDRTEESFAQYSAPTIAEVVMWLYEKHGIWIYVSGPDKNGWVIHWQGLESYPTLMYPSSPTEAYEFAIEYTLKNLI